MMSAAPVEDRPSDPDPGMRLAEQLKRAWVSAGRPAMCDVGDRVGYSKASISKVLAGKMPPAWQLVKKLGVTLGVPTKIVQEVWHPLWVAADDLRRQRPADVGATIGNQCPDCGTWVVDNQVHQRWHGNLDATAPPNRPDAHRWASLRDAVRRREV